MKKILSVAAVLMVLFVGCSEQMSVNSPVGKVNTEEPNWIALPQAEGMQVNEIVSILKTIDGSKGGSIELNNIYWGGTFGTVTLTSSLAFPKDSHKGKVTFTVSHDDVTCVSTFGPSYTFQKNLILNVKYTGVNLTGINPSTVKFAYLASDGSVQIAQHEGITVDASTGTLSVKNAKIPHFSRYGFVN